MSSEGKGAKAEAKVADPKPSTPSQAQAVPAVIKNTLTASLDQKTQQSVATEPSIQQPKAAFVQELPDTKLVGPPAMQPQSQQPLHPAQGHHAHTPSGLIQPSSSPALIQPSQQQDFAASVLIQPGPTLAQPPFQPHPHYGLSRTMSEIPSPEVEDRGMHIAPQWCNDVPSILADIDGLNAANFKPDDIRTYRSGSDKVIIVALEELRAMLRTRYSLRGWKTELTEDMRGFEMRRQNCELAIAIATIISTVVLAVWGFLGEKIFGNSGPARDIGSYVEGFLGLAVFIVTLISRNVAAGAIDARSKLMSLLSYASKYQEQNEAGFFSLWSEVPPVSVTIEMPAQSTNYRAVPATPSLPPSTATAATQRQSKGNPCSCCRWCG